MEEFLQLAKDKLGVDPGTAGTLAGGLMNAVKEKAGEADVSALAGKVPGLSDLMQKAAGGGSEEGSGSGGLLGALGGGGGLGGLVSGVMGGEAGDLMGLFAKSGLDASKAGSFVQLFVGFLKEKAGSALVEQVVGKVPALKALLG